MSKTVTLEIPHRRRATRYCPRDFCDEPSDHLI